MNNNITPAHVTYEQAVWLKSIEFNVPVNSFYTKPNSKMFGVDEHGRNYPIKNTAKKLYNIGEHQVLNGNNAYSAPEQSVVVEWLRVNFGVWIGVEIYHNMDGKFYSSFIQVDSKKQCFNGKETPQEAYSAALSYLMSNEIIKQK
jgi:hypothetical protein